MDYILILLISLSPLLLLSLRYRLRLPPSNRKLSTYSASNKKAPEGAFLFT